MNNNSKGKDKPLLLRADVAGLMSPLLADVYWPCDLAPTTPSDSSSIQDNYGGGER